jgi:ABC-type branched-subunit amino acid transport system substrate-binding protein
MQKTRVRRAGALLVGLALVAAACGDDDDDAPSAATTEAPATTASAATTEAPATTAAPATEAPDTTAAGTEAPGTTAASAGAGELEGLKGTTPKGADVSAWVPAVDEFWVAQGNPTLGSTFNYAAEAYDAVLTIALAVEMAQDDGSAHAAEIVGITKDGEKCTTYPDCLAIIQAGGDPDYDGISGPLDFNGNGEPLKGSYAILQFGPDNRITDEETLVTAESPESSIVDLVPVTAERAGDGVLKIGSLLPETGSLAFLGPPEFAGVAYAIDQINQAGGVLGKPVEYSQGDSGDTSTDTATVTSTRLLNEGVDAIIGAASSSVTLTVIDAITTAGVTMFSPANTSPALTSYDDKGLYFRDAPPDGLQGAIVSGLVQEDGNASVFILNLDDAYGNGISDVVETVLTDAGVEVLGHIAYDPTAASYDAEVGEVVAADPDAVVLVSFDEGSKILRTAVEQGIGPTVKNWYGVDGNMGNALGENFDAGT